MNNQYKKVRNYLLNIGENIETLRKQKRISPEQVAEATGMSLTTVHNIEKGMDFKVSSLVVYLYFLQEELFLADQSKFLDLSTQI